jgi:hypothetical protein
LVCSQHWSVPSIGLNLSFAARAQQGRLPVIGVLRPNWKDVGETFAEPFRRYMKAIGWEEGRNIRFLFVFAEGRGSASPPPHATLASRRLARPYLGRTYTG